MKSRSSDSSSRSRKPSTVVSFERNTPHRRNNCPPNRAVSERRGIHTQRVFGPANKLRSPQTQREPPGAVRHSRRKKRWNRATHMTGKRRQGETRGKMARLCTQHGAVLTVHTSCSLCTVLCALQCYALTCCACMSCMCRFALLRFASRTALGFHSFIHPFIHSFILSSIHPFIHSFILSFFLLWLCGCCCFLTRAFRKSLYVNKL